MPKEPVGVMVPPPMSLTAYSHMRPTMHHCASFFWWKMAMRMQDTKTAKLPKRATRSSMISGYWKMPAERGEDVGFSRRAARGRGCGERRGRGEPASPGLSPGARRGAVGFSRHVVRWKAWGTGGPGSGAPGRTGLEARVAGGGGILRRHPAERGLLGGLPAGLLELLGEEALGLELLGGVAAADELLREGKGDGQLIAVGLLCVRGSRGKTQQTHVQIFSLSLALPERNAPC